MDDAAAARSLFDVIGGGLASRMLWAALTSLAAFVGVGVYHKERRKFAGRWHMVISWTPEHAARLFGSAVADPHSVGDISVSYGLGPRRNQYWGLAYFELFAGPKRYAHLCVELEDMHVERAWFSTSFPFIAKAELKTLELRARIREALETFNYGEWSLYSMEFDVTSARGLRGRMVLTQTHETVGDVSAKRTG